MTNIRDIKIRIVPLLDGVPNAFQCIYSTLFQGPLPILGPKGKGVIGGRREEDIHKIQSPPPNKKGLNECQPF